MPNEKRKLMIALSQSSTGSGTFKYFDVDFSMAPYNEVSQNIITL